jgi:hypothetical protein
MPSTPEDVDALFDAPAPPAPVVPSTPLPLPLPRGTADGRREQRVKVSWPARVQLPNGKVIELRVRDLSDSGVGLLTDQHIPPSTVLNFAMGVPGLDQPRQITPVTGTIKTTYVVVQGRDMVCGGMWVSLPASARELLGKWIQRLRR